MSHRTLEENGSVKYSARQLLWISRPRTKRPWLSAPRWYILLFSRSDIEPVCYSGLNLSTLPPRSAFALFRFFRYILCSSGPRPSHHSKTTQALPSSQHILGQGPWNIYILTRRMILSAAWIWKTSALNQCSLSCPRHSGPIRANPQSQSLDSKSNSDHAQRLPATFPPFLMLTIIKHISLGWGDKFPVLSVGNGHSLMCPRSHTIGWSHLKLNSRALGS